MHFLFGLICVHNGSKVRAAKFGLLFFAQFSFCLPYTLGPPCRCPDIPLTYPNASCTSYDPVTISTMSGPRTPQLSGPPQAHLAPLLQRPLRPLISLKIQLYLLPKYLYQILHQYRRYLSPQMEPLLSSSPPRFLLPPLRNPGQPLRPLLSF